jgi:site-specific DNA recombinase
MNPMENHVLKAVGYRRVSMREQVNGHSLEAQSNSIEQYAAQQGWQLLRIYTDAGISAKKDSYRPELEHLLKDAATREFDAVVVDKIDRFYRHLNGVLTALDRLHQHGVAFASVKEKLDFTTPWGKLMLTVLGMLAEIYIDTLRQETQKGKQQRAREGLWNGSIPFWLLQWTVL